MSQSMVTHRQPQNKKALDKGALGPASNSATMSPPHAAGIDRTPSKESPHPVQASWPFLMTTPHRCCPLLHLPLLVVQLPSWHAWHREAPSRISLNREVHPPVHQSRALGATPPGGSKKHVWLWILESWRAMSCGAWAHKALSAPMRQLLLGAETPRIRQASHTCHRVCQHQSLHLVQIGLNIPSWRFLLLNFIGVEVVPELPLLLNRLDINWNCNDFPNRENTQHPFTHIPPAPSAESRGYWRHLLHLRLSQGEFPRHCLTAGSLSK